MMFLDNGFGSAGTYLTRGNVRTDVKGDLLATSFIPKDDKLC